MAHKFFSLHCIFQPFWCLSIHRCPSLLRSFMTSNYCIFLWFNFLVYPHSCADKGRWRVLFYFRLIKEEKENTEQRAEETESREGRGSLGSLPRFKSVSSLNLHPASSGASSCLPLPKPRRRQHRPAREGDRLGILTRVCVCLLPATSFPQDTGFYFVCFLAFLFFLRRKSGTFATLRGLKFFKLPSL